MKRLSLAGQISVISQSSFAVIGRRGGQFELKSFSSSQWPSCQASPSPFRCELTSCLSQPSRLEVAKNCSRSSRSGTATSTSTRRLHPSPSLARCTSSSGATLASWWPGSHRWTGRGPQTEICKWSFKDGVNKSFIEIFGCFIELWNRETW